MESLYGNEESFDISKCERLSFITGDKGSIRIRKFEEQTGAKILVVGEQTGYPTLIISGISSQRQEAKTLIRDALETTSFIPTISYFVLSETGANNGKLKFVKFDEKSVSNNDESNGKTRYFIEFLPQNGEIDDIDDITYKLDDFLHVTPRQFNTFDKIEDCLDRLSVKLQANCKKNSDKSSLFSEKIILKPRIFFGKVLFSEINNPEDSFNLHEWYNFNVLSGRGRRSSVVSNDNENYNGRNVNVEFQQDSPRIYEAFKILQRKFGFKWDDKHFAQGENKGSIYIYYTPSTNKKRKLKLHWNEEDHKWKIVSHSHGLNRLANIDIISGSKAPDFRLSLKTHYDLSSEGSRVEEVINKIQSVPFFDERDGMSFRSKDFDNTTIKRAVVRQIVDKKRFRNDEFVITFSTIHHDSGDTVSVQKLITLKHHTWTPKIELSDNESFMNNVTDTLSYVQEMMSVF